MPIRPRHYAVFILNPDGSGIVKQFDTWQEAMESYSDASNAGKAVYLYPQPVKAVGIAPEGPGAPAFVPPAATPIQFTAEQNVGQYQWPPHPPLPRPTEPPTGPFAPDNGYDAWIDYCKANPEHRECSIPGKPKFGTEILVCEPNGFPWKSTDGTEYPGSRPKIMLADGMGGMFDSNEEWSSEGLPFRKWYAPCQYPNGFREYQEFRVTSFKEVAISSLVGSTVQTIRNPLVVLRATRELVQYTNDIPSKVLDENGVLPRDVPLAERELEVNALREYVAGEPVFDFNFDDAAMGVAVTFPLKPTTDEGSEVVDTVTEAVSITVTETGNSHQVGTRTANIFESSFPTTPPDEIRNVTWDQEAGLGTGTWDVKMTSPTEFEFYFTPTGNTPPDARPPAGWAGTVVRGESPDPTNLRGGEFEGIDTTGVPAGGTYQGPWSYDYTPADTLIDSDSVNNYYTNGTGGYYAEPKEPSCPSSGTNLGTDPSDSCYDLIADGACGSYQSWNGSCDNNCDVAGTDYGPDPNNSCDNLYADGNCGTYSSSNGSCCDPSGTFQYSEAPTDVTYDAGCGIWTIGYSVKSIYADGNCSTYEQIDTTYNVGDIGECNGYIYSVDAAGNISTRDVPPSCDPSGTDYGVDPNDSCNNIYADGNCGTYTSANGSCCAPSGQWVSSDGCYDYYTDGSCGTYGMDNGTCGGGCDASGIYITSGSEAVYASTPCGDAQVGNQDYTEYTDGNCGSYRDYSNTTYYTPGQQVASCGDCTYYSNGDGTVYEDCAPPPPPCEDPNLHTEGVDGWTYDGCNWTQNVEETCFEPGVGDDATPDLSDPTVESMNYIYNADGSVYATWDGSSWVGGDVGSEE